MRLKKKKIKRSFFVLFSLFLMVLPVSASEQMNYFDTALLTDGRYAGATSSIIGQTLILTCDNYGEGYVYYSYAGSSLVSLRGCQTHFSFSALASADNGPQIAIRFYQGDAILQTVYCAPEVVYDITFPESTDSVRFYFYGNYAGNVVKGDTVTYSNIKLMGPGTENVVGFTHQIGIFFSGVFTWLGNVLDVITGNFALIVLCLAMPVIGFSVGLLCRIKS